MSRRCDSLEPLHSAWVDGELRGRERTHLAEHLQQCPRCRASIAELRVTRNMLRSLPARNLVVDVDGGAHPQHSRRWMSAGSAKRVVARSLAALVVVMGSLSAAAFAAGSVESGDRQVAVPVDVFVADHLVRAIGGPVSTPALLDANKP